MNQNEAQQVRKYVLRARLAGVTTRLYPLPGSTNAPIAKRQYGLELKADGRSISTDSAERATQFLRDISNGRRELNRGSRYHRTGIQGSN